MSGSHRCRDFEGYVLPQGSWRAVRGNGALVVAVEQDFVAYIERRAELLHEELSTVGKLISEDKHYHAADRLTAKLDATSWVSRILGAGGLGSARCGSSAWVAATTYWLVHQLCGGSDLLYTSLQRPWQEKYHYRT